MAPCRARTIAAIHDNSLHERSGEVVTLGDDPVPATVDSLAVWSEPGPLLRRLGTQIKKHGFGHVAGQALVVDGGLTTGPSWSLRQALAAERMQQSGIQQR